AQVAALARGALDQVAVLHAGAGAAVGAGGALLAGARVGLAAGAAADLPGRAAGDEAAGAVAVVAHRAHGAGEVRAAGHGSQLGIARQLLRAGALDALAVHAQAADAHALRRALELALAAGRDALAVGAAHAGAAGRTVVDAAVAVVVLAVAHLARGSGAATA